MGKKIPLYLKKTNHKNDIDIENLEEPKDEEEEKDSKEINYSDLREDDYLDMINEDIEENKCLYEEEKEIKKTKWRKSEKKGEIESVKNETNEKDEILDN